MLKRTILVGAIAALLIGAGSGYVFARLTKTGFQKSIVCLAMSEAVREGIVPLAAVDKVLASISAAQRFNATQRDLIASSGPCTVGMISASKKKEAK
ncbi:MAG: hypothetical protein KDJ47_01020 [Hyphomicrobiaceae bacterium]|nr:hypothetical protein [Hyphomicrobiaceae bacterium]